jgi:WD40 repeat protein
LLLSYRDKHLVDQLRLVDPVSGRVWFEAVGQEAVLSLDGKRLATSGADMMTQVYDIETGKVLQSWSPPRSADTAIRDKVRGFSADGQALIVQGEIVSVYSVQTGRQRTSWSLYRNKVLEMSEEFKRIQQSKQTNRPTFPLRHIQAVAVSHDGSKIAFGLRCERAPELGAGSYIQFSRLMILETSTGKLLHQSDLMEARFFHYLAFSPDGKRIAAGGVGPVRVWEVGTEHAARQFEGHRGSVQALAFSPDGRRLASASNDSTVLVWDLGK